MRKGGDVLIFGKYMNISFSWWNREHCYCPRVTIVGVLYHYPNACLVEQWKISVRHCINQLCHKLLSGYDGQKLQLPIIR